MTSFLAGLLLAAVVGVLYAGIPIVIGSAVASFMGKRNNVVLGKVLGIAIGIGWIVLVYHFLPMPLSDDPYSRY